MSEPTEPPAPPPSVEVEEPKRAKERESTPPALSDASGSKEFDFEAHRKGAVDAYTRIRDLYDRYSADVRKILKVALERKGIQFLAVDNRAKTEDSFGKKAVRRLEANPGRPKYPHPLQEVTDLAGVRVVAFYPSSVPLVCNCIEEEFEVLDRVDLRDSLLAEDRFGYLSVHYIVRLTAKRTPLAEYGQYRDLRAEIQVRTILQHAWAEIEHGIQYKSTATLPAEVHRRLLALAGLLEVADREFEGIRDADEAVRRAAAASIDKGEQLDRVEITPEALRLFLDKRIGPDARMPDFSYDWEAKRLRVLGFRTLGEVNECLKGHSDDRVSKILWGKRPGQLTRFYLLLQASMGEQFLARMRAAEPGYPDDWWDYLRRNQDKLRKGGYPVGNYAPPLPQSNDEIEHG